MASGMVEIVARAICVAEGCNPDHEGEGTDEGRFLWQNYRSLARAAIKSMREPTEAMKSAPVDGFFSKSVGGYLDEFQSCDVWQAMIDAALKE